MSKLSSSKVSVWLTDQQHDQCLAATKGIPNMTVGDYVQEIVDRELAKLFLEAKPEEKMPVYTHFGGMKEFDGKTCVCGQPDGRHRWDDGQCPEVSGTFRLAERVYPSDKSNEFNIVDLANEILGSQIRGRQ